MLFIASDTGKGSLIRLQDKTTHRNYSLGQARRYSTAFCPVEKAVVAFQARNSAFFFGAHTQQAIQRSFTPEQITSCAVSSCGTFLVGGGVEGSLLVWNLRTGQLLRNFKAHLRSITAVSFSADNSLVVTASEDSACKTWPLASLVALAAATDVTPLSSFTGHTLSVLCCTFMSHANYVVTGSADKTCRVFDAASGEQLASFTIGDAVTSVAVSADDSSLAVGTQAGFLCFRRLAQPAGAEEVGPVAGAEEAKFLAPSEDGHNSPVVFIRFVADPALSAGLGGVAGQPVVGSTATATPRSLSAVLTASENGAVLWYDAGACKLIGEAFPRQRQKIFSCCYFDEGTEGERKGTMPGLSKNPMDPTAKADYAVERFAKKPRKEAAAATTTVEAAEVTPKDKAVDPDTVRLDEEIAQVLAKNEELENLRDRMLKRLEALSQGTR